jgi:hypothetical protein
LPPAEILAIVRSSGFRPVGPLMLTGPVYRVRAIDPAGQLVRVVVSARMGRIVRVVPVGLRYAAPVVPPSVPYYARPYARPPAAVPPTADGYGPHPQMGPPDEFDDPVGSIPRAGPDGLPSVPGRFAARNPQVQRRIAVTPSQPPLPRPRPKLAAADPAAAPPTNDSPPAATVKPAAPPTNSTKPAAPPADVARAKPPAPPEEHYE